MGAARMRWTWLRVAGSAAVFAVLVWRVGTGPFVDGVRTVDAKALAAAVALGAVTTVCCAWRWKIMACGLGAELSLPAAIAAYYRSLFLNVTLPGGVVGDVHRGVSHGRDVTDVGRALRAVVWERFAGQAVQLVLTITLLLALPSPVHSSMPPVAIAILIAVPCVVLLGRSRVHLRLAWASWAAVVATSTLVVAGHALTFLIAARTAGTSAPVSRMVPLALLVLLVGVVPSVGGWGPREGATAWAFAAAGLGAAQGVATAVVYGVMVLVACLPGAAVLVISWARRTRLPARAERPLEKGATLA
jgi:glycosyltransferase 2 family protein